MLFIIFKVPNNFNIINTYSISANTTFNSILLILFNPYNYSSNCVIRLCRKYNSYK